MFVTCWDARRRRYPGPGPHLPPLCGATRVVRNGPNAVGTPSFLCRACGRRFVASPRTGPVTDDTRALIARPLGERMGLRAIARVTGVPRSWLQRFVNDLYREATPRDPGPLKKSRAPS